MLKTAIILHHPDTTIAKCYGDIDQIFRCSADALPGNTLHDCGLRFFHDNGDELCAADHPLQRIRNNGEAISGITAGIRSRESASSLQVTMDGYAELDSNGDTARIVTVYNTTHDTTAKNGASPTRIEQDWSRTFDAIADVVTILTPDLYILRANTAASSAFQLSQQQLLGRRCHEIFQGTAKGCERCPLVKDDRTTAPSSAIIRNKRLGKNFEVRCSPVLDDNGSLLHFVHTARDISKEETLQRQLQQAMKLEAIGTLAGGIAHDFNNILAAIIGYGQIAKAKLDKHNSLYSDIDQILLAGDRAAKLVKQILTFSRQEGEAATFHPLEMQFIIKEVVKLLRSSLPTTITINQDIQSTCPPILADPTQLHQVLVNLCTNAKHAIDDNHGCIDISLREHTLNETQLLQEIWLLPRGTYVHLSIADNGGGMSKETQAKIFDPFFTTKPKEQGTGLGLSVVHGIVEGHDGVITVDSIEGSGTTFDLYFPAIEKTRPTPPQKRQPLPHGDERIMVVDDEAPLAKMLELVLQGLGYRVTLFTDSLAAVAEYRKRPRDFDVVITDMTMPHMTGAELAREMLSIRPELPIILTTGYSETIDNQKAKRLGLRSLMLKPLKKAELAQTLRDVLDNA
ncbi:MAG: ATP-binding protein [Desulfopila sp.]